MKQLIIQGKIQWDMVSLLTVIAIFTGVGTAYMGYYAYDWLAWLIIHGLFYTFLIGLTSVCAVLVILLCTFAFFRTAPVLTKQQGDLTENILLFPCFIFFTGFISFIGIILKFIWLH